MTNAVAIPRIHIDIWPFEGGPIQLRDAQVLSCTVEKTLLADEGRFVIELPPGGPSGPEGRPSWSEIITPMSLCIIGMSRWQYQSIVMIGLVRTVRDVRAWGEEGVERTTIVEGRDFGCFFSATNWNALVVLAQGTGAAVGQGATDNPGLGLPAILGGRLLGNVGPDQVASAWFNQVFAGTGGILANTKLSYGLSTVTVGLAMGNSFEPYPGFIVPAGASFISRAGTWWSWFRDVMPFPWYETFVTTAPTGFYTGGPSGGEPPHGYSFNVSGLIATAEVDVIARIAPYPTLAVSVLGEDDFTFDGMDVSRWQMLPLFTPDSGYIVSDVNFSLDDVRNFYVVDPIYARLLWGNSNANSTPFFFQFASTIDETSVERYGLKPEIRQLSWFADPTGDAAVTNAQMSANEWQQLVGDVMMRLASFHQPVPLMAQGDVTYPLRPDILPGCRFSYAPFSKISAAGGTLDFPASAASGDNWIFYIDSVAHRFVFGGPSTTTLRLSRGLPDAVYADPAAGGLLEGLHLGTVQRVDGEYIFAEQAGLGLRPFNLKSANSVLSDLSQTWQKAQAN